MSILDTPTTPPSAASEAPAASVDERGLAVGAAAQHVPDLPAEAAPSAAVPTLAPPAASAVEEAPAAASASGSAENSAEKPRGRPFEPGQSGNPNGRPKGSRNRVTQAIEALIDGEGEAIGAKAVEMALGGDPSMLRALLRTLVPSRRDRIVEFELPKVETAADALAASSAVLAACSRGELSPNEASEIMALISTHVRTVEVAEIEERLAALEQKQEK
jgi:hypothetical protein